VKSRRIVALKEVLLARKIQRVGAVMTKNAQDGSPIGKSKACCYEPVEKLGTGGMGEVWKAKHGMLERPAAIKFIRPDALGIVGEAAAMEVLQQFEREAQATAALNSPHTIDLYDFGVTEDGRFYYVMELLEGLNLQTLVERYGPVSADRAIHFLRQACHSLAEAHASGLIHRDIKPANIYMCRRGLDYDFIKVLDFGLVRRFDHTDRTQTAVIAGTPAFMAPEIALGNRPVDGRADLYALGCVAYWLVTGRPVFDGDSVSAVIMKHIQEKPLSPRTFSEIEIPEQFERVVLNCLEKDPGDRPQSAKELTVRLRKCVDVAGTWTEDQAEYWWTLHRPHESKESGRRPA
jgi:serine/threonine-protein kinase